MERSTIKEYLHQSKLGFIGAGKMAQAIAEGLVKQGSGRGIFKQKTIISIS